MRSRLARSLTALASLVTLGAAGCSSSSPQPSHNADSGTPADASGTVTPDGSTSDAGSRDAAVSDAAGKADASASNDAGASNDPAAVSDAAAAPDTGTSDAAGTDGGGPSLSNVCPVVNPSNTSFATAQAVTLDSSGNAAVGSGVVKSTEDWFQWTAPKNEPAHVWVTYTIPTGSTTQLNLEDDDISDTYITEDGTPPSGTTGTLTTTFETTAGGTYASKITSNSATCTPFAYHVAALYCTDQFEDNDTQATAAPLTLVPTSYTPPTTWATATKTISANIDGLDDDVYAVTAPLSDPMSAAVTYTRPAGDTVHLNIEIDDAAGYVTEDGTPRTTASQTLTTVWQAKAGSTYYLKVTSDKNGVCADYTANVNGLWCTDNYEDNDDFAKAATLPNTSASPATATISSFDADYYVIPNPGAAGSCTVTYTPPSGSSQQLSIELDDSAQQYITEDGTARTTSTGTLTVNWSTGDAPYFLRVSATEKECTTYTITCMGG